MKMGIISGKKRIAVDMALNIAATALPTFVLQLLILPSLSRHMSDERYGLLVTILALLNVLPSTMGNVLNNIRLLYDSKYREDGLTGDFNVLLLIMAGVNLLIVAAFSYFYEQTITPISVFLVLLVSVVWLMKEYFIVAFRLRIDYVAILINNVLQVVGYGIGYALFLWCGKWHMIYLTGYVVSLIYIFIRCDLWQEPLRITPLFRKTTWQSVLLLVSSLLTRVITYADKILIYPLLGGAVVSVYYAATVFGKVVALAITPINAVALTYLAKIRQKTDSVFRTTFLIGVAVCAAGYVICVLISRPVLTLLYPQYVDDAMKYIIITTGTTVLFALISIINPFILKFFDMKWQIAINGGTAAFYVVICLLLLKFWGLYGFCVGTLLTNAVKLVFMLLIYRRAKALVL